MHDVAIIGGGAGGLVVASVAAQLGLDVVLINKEENMGGDCLHYGCIPSKTLIKSASVAHTMVHADRWGLDAVEKPVDIRSINQTIKNVIDSIQVHDSRERFEELGCDVITGDATFTSPSQIEVNGKRIDAKRFVIATGSSTFIPPIKGLKETTFLTNEDMYSLPSLPKSMIILGGGPIGVEMAQAYSRFGTQVTIVELAPRLLPRMDKEASLILADVLGSEGVSVHVDSEVVEIAEQGEQIQVILKDGQMLMAEKLLVAIGRRPVVDTLNLEKAKVDFSAAGIKVNRKMQTSNKKIYACGDVTGEMPLTHVAELQAGVVIANILFKIPKKVSYQVVPSVVYSSPECAQVGMSTDEADKISGIEILRFDYAELDRAIAEHTTAGVAKLIVRKGRIVGAHIVGARAGDIIHELALAIQEKMKVSQITSLVHAYPSFAQMNKRLAGQYYKDRLFSKNTRRLVKFLTKF